MMMTTEEEPLLYFDQAPAAERLLAMDIETMGLMCEDPLPAITCACLYDGAQETRLLFCGAPPEQAAANAAALLRALDEAPAIAGYNAVYFDLPFVQRAFGATEAQLQGWVAKCVDPFMCAKHVLRRPCRLQRLLELNGLGSKTGSGSNAIVLAREGRTQELLDYCLADARLTHELCTLPEFRLGEAVRVRFDRGVWRLRYDAAPPAPTLEEALPSLREEEVALLYAELLIVDPSVDDGLGWGCWRGAVCSKS